MSEQLSLAFDDWEGPLDLLLDLARRQKVDLARISVDRLADQYAAFVAATRPRLELAADWLVMAAWLAYLKSRLLVPAPAAPEPEAEAVEEQLRHRLRRLDAMRAAARALAERPRLGRDVFARGAPEGLVELTRRAPAASAHALAAAYAALQLRRERRAWTPPPRAVVTLEAALATLETNLPRAWTRLDRLLPGAPEGGPPRSRLASTVGAALELARTGRLDLRQAGPFRPVELRAR